MVLDSDRERIVLFGGHMGGLVLNDTWEWDGSTWSLCHPEHPPPPRYDHAMAYDPVRRQVVMFGGFATVTSGPTGGTWTWDGDDWTLAAGKPGPVARNGHAMAFARGLGAVILFGGQTTSGPYPDDTWAWDGFRWTMLETSTTPGARFWHCMSEEPATHGVLMTGGQTVNNSVLWRFDGHDWRAIQLSHSPPYRWNATMSVDPRTSRVMLIGGTSPCSSHDDVWSFDVVHGWSRLADLPNPMSVHAAAADPRGAGILSFGGATDSWGYRGDGWYWNGQVWTESVSSPPPHIYGDMVYDAARSEVLLVFSNRSVETWIRSEGSWRRAHPTVVPSNSLAQHLSLSCDELRGRVVAITCTQAGTRTWEWDGTDWILAPTSTTPPGAHPMAFDPVRRQTIWCGSTSLSSPSETWAWDGNTWTRLSPVHSPTSQSLHAMAWDDHRQRIILFGGQRTVAPRGSLDETWEWDGEDWRRIDVPGPAARVYHALAYDPVRERTVLFGGYGRPRYLDDLWEFDGRSWRRRAGIRSIGGRHTVEFAWDAFEQRLLLFGGASADGPDLSDAWTFGTTHAARIAYHGSRCFSGNRTPHLRSEPGSRPWLGETLRLVVDDLSPRGNGPTFGILGVSDSVFDGRQLPLGLGHPGCSLRISPDVVEPMVRSGSEARWGIPIPSTPTLAGSEVYAQAITVDPGANASGVVTTNSATLTIGAR